MAGAKKSTPPPIDRPLARAYLKDFTGWATSSAPGVSDPRSLRIMHNCTITTEGSLEIRPGLRHVLAQPLPGPIVGDLEPFVNAAGARCLLTAYRFENKVYFAVLTYSEATQLYSHSALTNTFPGASAEALAFNGASTSFVRYVQVDNKILALSNNEETFRLFWVGPEYKASVPQEITRPVWGTSVPMASAMPASAWIAGAQSSSPWDTAGGTASAGTDTLISSDASKNIYNFGYFFTFSSDIGETPGSRVMVVKMQRRWTAWNLASAVDDDRKAPDQLAIRISQDDYETAQAQGAVAWNLYMFTWSNQDNVPSEAVRIRSLPMVGKSFAEAGWTTHTPLIQGHDIGMALPQASPRDNFTKPSAAANGLVAGDRVVLVHDMLNGARITWSSNLQGDYLNFSSNVGGGFKTLTHGNLVLPAAVELWQNPQSTDTITVLCSGVDGYGTAYYMNPNSTITSQSQATLVMGFEETTATPGTVSPFGCEVLNNALYHPLHNNLMKSTASNYNINHTLMADPIQNVWAAVPAAQKKMISSAQMDSTLYYLIQSPVGTLAAEGSEKNQVWLCNTALTGAWSCWDVRGTSLRKLEIGGQQYVAIASGSNLFVFDPTFDSDDVWTGSGWSTEGIPWEIETNSQGANRAHDAWATLQQANVTFGSFTGECVYGIRGLDVNGLPVEVSKHFVSPLEETNPLLPVDQGDFLLIRRIMREWRFFWRSTDRPKRRSHGALGYVQYTYTPASVNVGYEYGSVETFQYTAPNAAYPNAVPRPNADTYTP